MVVHPCEKPHERLIVHGAESVTVGVQRDGFISYASNTNTLDGTDGWILIQSWADQPGSLITRRSYDVRNAEPSMGWCDEYYLLPRA